MNRRPPQARDLRDREARERSRVAIAERRSRNRRKPDVWGAVRTVALFLVLAECLRVAFTSPRLNLQHVEVSGKTRYSSADLVRQAGIPMGRNLFGVNLAKVHQRLMSNPVLKEVQVSRSFPDTLVLTVVERTPALQITSTAPAAVPAPEMKGDASAATGTTTAPVAPSRPVLHADREGVVFQTASALRDELPVIDLAQRKLPALGERLSSALNTAAWECVELARQERIPVRAMRVDAGGELWLNVGISASKTTTRSGSNREKEQPEGPAEPPILPVRLGLLTDLPEKFRDVRMVLVGAPQVATADYLDVMSAGNPAFKVARRTSSSSKDHAEER